jgi:hypothetical protein
MFVGVVIVKIMIIPSCPHPFSSLRNKHFINSGLTSDVLFPLCRGGGEEAFLAKGIALY